MRRCSWAQFQLQRRCFIFLMVCVLFFSNFIAIRCRGLSLVYLCLSSDVHAFKLCGPRYLATHCFRDRFVRCGDSFQLVVQECSTSGVSEEILTFTKSPHHSLGDIERPLEFNFILYGNGKVLSVTLDNICYWAFFTFHLNVLHKIFMLQVQ